MMLWIGRWCKIALPVFSRCVRVCLFKMLMVETRVYSLPREFHERQREALKKGSRRPLARLEADTQVRHILLKNMEALPMSFNGRDDNPWEFSDIVFHVPFYQEVRPAGHAAHEDGDEFCCFGHNSGKAPTTLWGRIFGSQEKKEEKAAGVCFAREAVTVRWSLSSLAEVLIAVRYVCSITIKRKRKTGSIREP